MASENENTIGILENVSVTAPVILIVGGSEDNQTTLKKRILMTGYGVDIVDTKSDAIDILNGEKKVDVIFVDYKLADGDAIEFLKLIKSSDQHSSIPVIVTDNIDDIDRMVNSVRNGAEDVLIRPLHPTILKARLENAIAKKKSHDAALEYIRKIQEDQRKAIEKEQMSSLGSMALAISNELQNPLNLVINLSDITLKTCEGLAQKIIAESSKISEESFKDMNHDILGIISNLAKISQQSKRSDRIMRFMIDQASISSSQRYLADINEVVTDTVKILISDYKEAGKHVNARINLIVDNTIPKKIMLATHSLSKAIYNIIENSIYAVNAKGLEKEEACIEIKTLNSVDYVSISIHDNGVGIETELTRRIFEPFFSTKSSNNFTGLGLSAVSESIVRIHNGSINIKSELGEFTEITLNIPKKKK